jgi:hypothetical protein
MGQTLPKPMPGPSEIEIRPIWEASDFGEAMTEAAAEVHERVRQEARRQHLRG